jgi:hypothetical protein
MPYPEYRSWELFYLLEPWGWHNSEYHAAVNMAMLYNINRSKGKPKEVKDFFRDMPKEILDQLKEAPDVNELSREDIIKRIKKDFGI